MVRTQSPQYAFRIDVSRILALSTAIALHLLALSLLLIPLSHRAVPHAPAPVTPRWQLPILVPTPPSPPTPVEALPPPTPPAARTIPAPTPALPAIDAVATEAAAVVTDPAPALPDTRAADATLDTVAPAMPGSALRYLQAPPPPYPRAALAGRQQGTVLLQVRVGVDGVPVEVTVARSSGFRVLDQAARLQVLKHWRFHPAMRDGQAVEALGMVPLAFSLD